MNRARTVRWHLIQVLLAGLLPIGAFAATLLFMHWQAQESQRRALQMEATRLLGNALDNALESSVQRLAILARQWSVREGDDAQLYEAAKNALTGSPDWENMLAFKASGEGIFHTDRPFGTALPAMQLRDYSAVALKQNRPTLSELFVNRTNKTPVVGVAHPVSRDGVVTHVLIASLNLQWFDELLKRHQPADGSIGGIFDHKMKFVARSHDGEARRGSDPAPQLHESMRVEKEGLGRFPSLDNTSVYTSWAATRHGWVVALATPAAPIDGAFWRYMALLGALLLAMLFAGLSFAALKGRRITASLSLLEARAAELARGRTLKPSAASHIAEVDRVLRALDDAAGLLASAQTERDRLLQSEQHGRAAAEQANRAKDEFLAMLGHELRNPLAAVSNAAAILQSRQCSAPQLEFAAGVIARQSAHLKRLIDDLLDVGRVMTGKILLERRPLELDASVRHVVSTLQTAGTLARHRVRVQTRPVWVNGDHTRVEQVVSNLLVNAATYTPAGGEIRIELAEDADEALLRVSDTGQGVRAEHMERIFELFFQVEASGARVQGGLGIGLTLVKRLVELHGGRVAVESAGLGRGACFTVRLPAIGAPARPSDTAEAAQPAAKTVLVVEDNADERESLRVALELHGHRVLHASDARSALEQIEKGRPSIAVVDIGLPGMDGYALAREVRARFDGAGPALVALTGYGSDEDVRRAKEAGFARHLTKPVEVAELAAIVSRTVS
jgi:signal transduction histidine kinase/ActR/RegA family two-component response regulator